MAAMESRTWRDPHLTIVAETDPLDLRRPFGHGYYPLVAAAFGGVRYRASAAIVAAHAGRLHPYRH